MCRTFSYGPLNFDLSKFYCTVSCYSTLGCKDITDTTLDIEEFDPMDHGLSVQEFQIVEIGTLFFTEQMRNETTNNNVTCYGPDVISGIEEDCKKYVLLGVMPFIKNESENNIRSKGLKSQ